MMSVRVPASIVLVACMCGCGDAQTAQLTFTPSIPWSSAISCPNAGQLGPLMRAVFDIDGVDLPCPLDVNPGTLAAAGVCEAVPTGSVTYLGLEYYYHKPSNHDMVSLSYTLGFVDLRASALSSSTESVEVDMSGDGVHSLAVDTPDELDHLGSRSCEGASGELKHLCETEKWAKKKLIDRGYSLDLNQNGTANLVEVCTSGLESP